MDSVDEGESGRSSTVSAAARGGVGVLLFLLAIRLLGEATGAVAGELSGVLATLGDRPVSALGLGWLATYLLTNGSVVAAMGMTVTEAGYRDPGLIVALVSGSRLGAAAFVVGIGVLDHLRRRRSLHSGTELGMLSFVVSHALYVPAVLLTWISLPLLNSPLAGLVSRIDPLVPGAGIVDAAAQWLVGNLGATAVAALGVIGLFLAVGIVDRALEGVDLERIRSGISPEARWLSFLAGLGVTAVTSSVAFSIGVLVPLFNRGALTRKEVAPYVLGANVSTLIDTFVVGLVLRSWDAAGAVLALMLWALALSIPYMLVFSRAFGILDLVLDRLTTDRATFVVFLISLVAAPLLLLLVGGVL